MLNNIQSNTCLNYIYNSASQTLKKTLYMKNKKNLPKLVAEFLKSSPRNLAIKRNGILPQQYQMNLSKLPTDQQYIKNFIVHIQCTYMYSYYGPPTVAQHKMYLHRKSFINPLSVGLVRKKAIELNDKAIDKKTVLFQLIKLLNKDKQSPTRYVEIQQFLINLTIAETRQYKKFIVYLYKWLLNQKHQFPASSIQQQLCQQTSELIIRKIYQAHEKGDIQILRNTQAQLMSIEVLQKARQQKRNSQLQEAKQSYEIVYFSKMTEQVDRLQALEYICERCKSNQDYKYLQSMGQKIKQSNGIKAHEKILLRTVNEIKNQIMSQLFIPLMNTNTNEIQNRNKLAQSLMSGAQILLDRGMKQCENKDKIQKIEKTNDILDNGKNN